MSRRSVLVVSPFLPWPVDFGGAARVYHLLRGMAQEHDVILLAPALAGEWDAVLSLGEICDVTAVQAAWTTRQPAGIRKRLTQLRSVPGRRSFQERALGAAPLQAALDRLFQTRKIDVVQFEFSQTGTLRLPRPCPTVLDIHNIEHELLRRVAHGGGMASAAFNTVEAERVRQMERAVWQRVTVCVTTSERDAETVRAVSDSPTIVVPNGVDIAHFAPTADSIRRPHHAIFTGAMRHAPNAEGAAWYVERVLPIVQRELPDSTITLAGADPPPAVRSLTSNAVSVTGTVPDMRPYFAESSVAVVPLLAGGGTRLKILEAFASRLPVVSTTLGAEGLDVRHGEHLLLADTPEAFATAVVRVMTEQSLAHRLADAAEQLVRERYDWQAIVPKLIAAHDMAVQAVPADGLRRYW